LGVGGGHSDLSLNELRQAGDEVLG
jgi:hypothetical protein